MRSDFYAELIRRNDILAVARELGLDVRGTKCRCLRPERHAHGDRTPSLSLNGRDNTFRCWVCADVRGSVIDLVMLARGLPRGEAVAYLAARVGLSLPERRSGPPRRAPGRVRVGTAADTPAPQAAPPPPPAVDDERAHEIFSAFLRWCDRPSQRGYLTRARGISRATLDRMRVVWVHDPAGIERRLRDRFSEEELVGSGLFSQWGLLFRQHRIVFPFLRRERVVFLQGRRTDSGEPKYLSIRRAIPCLYNHDVLAALPPGSPVLLCEGVLDTLTWLDHDAVAVGILGVGAFKHEWIEALRPFRVLLCLDNDEPGARLARSLLTRFHAAGLRAQIVALPEGVKDINQLFVAHPHLLGRLRL